MSTTHRIAVGIIATLALATAAPASATPWDPNSRDPSIPIRPAAEPATIAPAPIHAGKNHAVLVTGTTDVTVQEQRISTPVVSGPPAGCLRDPQTHALFCSDSAAAPFGISTPPGYVRDSDTRELLRPANPPSRAGRLPVDPSHGQVP